MPAIAARLATEKAKRASPLAPSAPPSAAGIAIGIAPGVAPGFTSRLVRSDESFTSKPNSGRGLGVDGAFRSSELARSAPSPVPTGDAAREGGGDGGGASSLLFARDNHLPADPAGYAEDRPAGAPTALGDKPAPERHGRGGRRKARAQVQPRPGQEGGKSGGYEGTPGQSG